MALEAVTSESWEWLRSWARQVVPALVILVAFWGLGSVLSRTVRRLSRHLPRGKKDILALLASVIRFTSVVLGVITALGTLGVDVSALVAGLGLTGFALGFALKDALSNLLAGLLILIYEPFTPGAVIRVSGVTGRVEEINLRYTVLQGDKEVYLVPNSILLNNLVIVERRQEPGGARA
ncbi:MAG: mechanosensitive ion channel [Acidobacteriota bacterium]